jgi:KaiC/GvpD/RAD55 family RecA-like ATPase
MAEEKTELRNKTSAGNYDLNKWLYGGYDKDIITTIFGPAGSGKSNFCMMVAASAARKGGKVIFIDTEGNFSFTDQERLKIIESQLDRLADSVKNLLSFTRQPKPQLRPLDVNEILRELIQLSEPWLSSRNVKLFSSLSFLVIGLSLALLIPN